jgi:hypothetical protein
MTATSNPTTSSTKPTDKLRDGPCSGVYELVDKCAESKGVDVSKHKEKLQSCPSETDALIKCMNKNPKYFY